ncbi:MAG: YkgJ family cysteine cluster protein [Planctomycetaceae bacterium]|jgi:Fe-S-cluster containining protein
MSKFPITREQLPPGGNLCEYCTALCCHYYALPMDEPKTWRDFDNIRWFMIHGTVTAYVHDGVWYLCTYQVCRHLQPDYRCGIYETRPEICREYSTTNCDYDDHGTHDMLFETPEQIWEYAHAILPPRRGSNGKSTQTVDLPILN